nr:hypothetical protein [Tanacetum cinerariifolium]
MVILVLEMVAAVVTAVEDGGGALVMGMMMKKMRWSLVEVITVVMVEVGWPKSVRRWPERRQILDERGKSSSVRLRLSGKTEKLSGMSFYIKLI